MIKEISDIEEIRRFRKDLFDLAPDDTITKITVEYEPFSWISYYKNELRLAQGHQKGSELRIKLLEMGVDVKEIERKNIFELEELLSKKHEQ